MTLVIQSNIPGRLDVWLIDGAHQVTHQARRIQHHGSEFLLSLVNVALLVHRRSIKQLQQIFVVQGPGPFTAVRTGIVVANTLGFTANVLVQGIRSTQTLTVEQIQTLALARSKKKAFQAVHPWYGKQPNITKAS